MKRLSALIAAAFMLCSCYEDFVKDFDYSSAYFPYQYELRTFVIGEGQSFNIPVCLGGVMQNSKDRVVSVVLDNNLLTTDIGAEYGTDPENPTSFTAYDVYSAGSAAIGKVIGDYLKTDFTAGGSKNLEPMPGGYVNMDLSNFCIKSGNHTGSSPITATDAMLNDGAAYQPYYSMGFKLVSADVDSVLFDKSFLVVVTRCENMFYGKWYHGGSYVVKDASGKVVKEETYPFAIPQEDSKVYTLTTTGKNSVKTDKYIQNSGSLILTFNGNDITISSDNIELLNDSRKSYFNDSKLLQERELHLNYTFRNTDGGSTEVSDILYFRNRIRDGVNEWQDENETHYN